MLHFCIISSVFKWSWYETKTIFLVYKLVYQKLRFFFIKRVKNWNCPPSHFSLKRIGGWAQFFFLSGGGGSHQQSADWYDWDLNERYFTSPRGHSSPNLPTTLYTVLYMTKFSSISLYMTKLFVTESFEIARWHSSPHLPTTLHFYGSPWSMNIFSLKCF